MKKNILLVLLCLLIFSICAIAEVFPYKIYACSTHHISSSNIITGKLLTFHSIDNYNISETEVIEEGSVVTVKVKEYIKPKRGKRNGYAKVKMISYTKPSKSNETINVQNKYLEGTLKLSSPHDLKDMAKKAGISVAGHVLKFPGFSQAVAVTKGLVEPNPNQNRFQSAGTNLYRSTPLTYTEKGHNLDIEEDAIVVISVKSNE